MYPQPIMEDRKPSTESIVVIALPPSLFSLFSFGGFLEAPLQALSPVPPKDKARRDVPVLILKIIERERVLRGLRIGSPSGLKVPFPVFANFWDVWSGW